MIGNDDNQEEVSFKVADRRKFNADGSVKDGVTLEPAPAKEKPVVEKDEPVVKADNVDLNESVAAESPLEDDPEGGEIHCPYCGSYGAKIVSGEEFYLESIETK